MSQDAQQVKRRLQRMDDYDFEHFVADIWERRGWDCEVSQASSDAGIDVTATKSTPYKQKKLIQAKRYGTNTTVGGPDIQQYASLKHQQPDADSVVIVTSNRFTNSAEERAHELNVKLVDGDDLAALVEAVDGSDLLDRYDPQPTRDEAETPTTEVTQLPPDTPTGRGPGRSNSEGVQAGSTATVEETDDSPKPLREGDGALSPESSPGWLQRLEQSRQWHRLIPIGVVVWLAALMVGGAVSGLGSIGSTISGLIALGVWFPLTLALPVMWYLDMRYVRARTDWTPTFPKYIIVSIFTAFAPVLYYYYKRYRTIGL